MDSESILVLTDIAKALEGIERHLRHFVKNDAVYCLECGKELSGSDLRWHRTNNEILNNGGNVENYCICQDCIEARLQKGFDEICNKVLDR